MPLDQTHVVLWCLITGVVVYIAHPLITRGLQAIGHDIAQKVHPTPAQAPAAAPASAPKPAVAAQPAAAAVATAAAPAK